MVPVQTLVLSSGGLRSLVALASTLAGVPNPREAASRTAVLHLRDPHPAAERVRSQHVRKQADHLGVSRVFEIDLPHLHARVAGQAAEPNTAAPTALFRPQVLLVGLAHAVQLGAPRLVYPAHAGGNLDAAARLTEQCVLLQNLAQLEHDKLPGIDLPLLEFTDQQLIELGAQLGVPWELAWSCLLTGDRPCKLCAACRRRKSAFDAAGTVDPLDRPSSAHRQAS